MEVLAPFLVLGLIIAAAVGTGAAFGAIAYFRMERYRRALLEQAARITALEAQLAGHVPALPARREATEASPVVAPPEAEVLRPTPVSEPSPAPPPVAEAAKPAPVTPVPVTPLPKPVAAPRPAAVAMWMPAEPRVAALTKTAAPALAPTLIPPPSLPAVPPEPEPAAVDDVAEAVAEAAPTPPEPIGPEPAPPESVPPESMPAETVASEPVAPEAEPVVETVPEPAASVVAKTPEPEPQPEPKFIAPPEPVVAKPPFIKPEVFAPPAPDTAPAPVAAPAFALNMNVVVWAIGAMITLAIIALLVYANERGFFGQMSQLLLGYLIAAAMIGAAEAMRRRNVEEAPTDWQTRNTPTILAVVGVICAYGITYVGLARLHLLPPPAAIGLMGLCALGALALSLRHGRALAWEGLVAGFAAPALVAVIGSSATALFAYLFAIAAAAFALTKHRGWLLLGWATAALALAWSAYWTFMYFLPTGAPAASSYLVALAVLGAAFTWDHAREPVNYARAALLSPWPAPAWIGMATIAGACVLLVTLSIHAGGAGTSAIGALVMLTGLLAIAATLREGFSPAPVFIGAVALVSVATWPPIEFATDARAFTGVAGALGFVSSIGGWLMMARNRAPGPGAMLAALVPTGALLIAYLRLGGVIQSPLGWGGAALILAAFNGFALDRISSAAGGASKAPGATGAFSAAAAACAVMAGAFALDHVRLAAGVAVLLAPLAWLDRRLNIPALRFTGAAIGAVTVALLSPIALMRAPVDPTPLLNMLAPTFIIAILSVWAGARLFAMGPAGYNARITIFLRIALIALVLSFGWAEIRHLANRGVLTAPYASLLEMGGHTAFLLVFASAAAWRYGRLERPLVHRAEMIVFAIALAHIAVAGLGILSPWWGTAPAAVAGPPVASEIAVAYLLPAGLFALYGVLRARMGPSMRAHVAGAATIVCIGVWALLETRHIFHPGTMALAPVTPLEHGAYSAALIVCSGLLVAFALRFDGKELSGLVLRLSAAGLCAVGFLKALAIDIGLIDGPVRYAAYALVAAAAAGAFLGYYRYVFPRAPVATNEADADGANLLPPRP